MGERRSRHIWSILLVVALSAFYSSFISIYISKRLSLKEIYEELPFRTPPKDEADMQQGNGADEGFSACLLWMDDNHILVEWLAYHYHVLPLRRLIIAVDPASKTSPNAILKRWNRTELGLSITRWDDEDYLPQQLIGALPVDAPYQEKKDRHRSRQRTFLRRCMIAMKESNRTWTTLFDTDEYLVFNNDRYEGDEPPSSNVANGWPPRPKVGEKTVMQYLQGVHNRNSSVLKSPCILMPRLLFGSLDSPEEERNKDVPIGVDAMKLDTLRFRMHHKKKSNQQNGLGKTIIDLSRVDIASIPEFASVHRPVPDVCPKRWAIDNDPNPPFRVNHYLGSWEAYSFRDDARAGAEKSREKFEERSAINDGNDDYIRPWIGDFVGKMGKERSSQLLEGAGFVPEKNKTIMSERMEKSNPHSR